MHAITIVLRKHSGALLCLGSALSCLSGAACAASPSELVAEPLPLAIFSPVALPAPAPANSSANGNDNAMPNDSANAATLDKARGGTGIISNAANLSGVVSNNSATHVITGANIIQSNSFANASGIPVVIQNSGANVLIQNATVINLQLK